MGIEPRLLELVRSNSPNKGLKPVDNLNQENPDDDVDDVSLVPVEVVAKMLGISVRSVWRRLSAGDLVVPRKIGRCRRWCPIELRKWITAGCPSPVAPSSKR